MLFTKGHSKMLRVKLIMFPFSDLQYLFLLRADFLKLLCGVFYYIENKSRWRRADAAFIISPGINLVYYKKLF